MQKEFTPLPGGFENHLKFFSDYDPRYDVHYSLQESQFKYVGGLWGVLPYVQSIVNHVKGYYDSQITPYVLRLLQEIELAKKELRGEEIPGYKSLEGRAAIFRTYGEKAEKGIKALMETKRIVFKKTEIDECFHISIRIGTPLQKSS